MTCTYSGTNYVALKVGGTANEGLNAPVYFDGFYKDLTDVDAIQVVLASAATSIVDIPSGVSAGAGFTYDQQGVPSTPANGETWRERNGSSAVVNEWYYDGADWIASISERSQLLMSSTNALAASLTNTHTLLGIAGTKILIESMTVAGSIASGHDASNYWSFVLSRITTATAKTAVTTYTTATNLSSFGAASIAPVTTAINTKFDAASTIGFTFDLNKTGTVGNLSRAMLSVGFRRIR